MPVLNLLQAHEKTQLEVIVSLDSMGQSTKISLHSLALKLDMSEFTLRGVLQTLEAEALTELSKYFSLTFANGIVHYQRVSNASPITALRYAYSRRSDYIALVEHSFHECFSTVEDYVADESISRTTFFRKRKILREYFADRHLDLSESLILTVDEITIRELYYHHYSVLFGDFSYPFSDKLKASSERIIDAISKALHITLSDSQKLSLLYYTYVKYNRIMQGHLLTDHMPIARPFFVDATELVDDDMLASTIAIFDESLQRKNIHLSQHELTLEANGYLNFMISLRMLPIPVSKVPNFLRVTAPLKEQLVKTFAVAVNQSYWSLQPFFFKQDVTPIDIYLYHLVCYNHPESEVTTTFHNDYLDSNFADYEAVAQSFMDWIAHTYPNKHADITLNNVDFCNDILYLLIATVPRHVVDQPISVALDINYGFGYTEMLKRQIATFFDLNVIITEKPTETTDIIISNVVPKTPIRAIHLEWSNPPTYSDIELFKQAVRTIQCERKGCTDVCCA